MGRDSERGSALLVTLLLTISLIAGGAVLFRMQLFSTRSTAVVTEEITALNCAESAVSAARPFVAANVAGWNASLCNPPPPRGTGACVIGSPIAEPAWLAPMSHDLDGDGVNDVVLTLVDNDDDSPLDPQVDVDKTVHIIATCKIREARVQVTELVHYDTATSSLTRKLWLRTE